MTDAVEVVARAIEDYWRARLEPPSPEKLARAALAAMEAAGLAVVPVEPTQDMLDVVCSDDPCAIISAKDQPVRETWREMVEARPR